VVRIFSGTLKKQVLQEGEKNMKTFLRYFTIAAGIVTLSCMILLAQPDTLTIIHVNDTHSNLDPYGAGAYGGIARAATVIGFWKATEPNPILLHAGDFMVGNLMFNAFFGVPELKILNQLGFDALVLGNHEFDVGPEYLTGILVEAELDPTFHILGTNVTNLEAVPPLDQIVKSHAIKEVGGIRVGIIGLTTPAANIQSNPQPLYIDDNIVQIAMEEMFTLRAAGAQVVILLSHLGLSIDMTIAQWLEGIDVIVGGHSHTPLHEVVYVNNIPIVHAGEFYSYVGRLQLEYDGTSTTVISYATQQITDAIDEVETIAASVTYLQGEVTSLYNEVIGDPYEPIAVASRFMYTEPLSFDVLDTPMGNLVTSAMLGYDASIDCSLEPTGHIVGGGLFEGPVTPAELFRAYPYGYDLNDHLGFRMATYLMSGEYIYYMLRELLTYINPAIGDYEYLIQSAGLDYVVYITPDGYELGEVYIQGQPLDPGRLYKIASSDMVVNYMQMLFGLTPPGLQVQPVSVFQVVKEYVDALDVLDITSTGHNRAVDFTKPAGIVGYLIERIQHLTSMGVVNEGQGNALIVKLNNALAQIARTKYIPAENQINAFINQIDDFVLNGILSPEIGEYLKGLAARILDSLGADMLKKDSVTGQIEVTLPSRCSMGQNYPNPFNPVTNIPYVLPSDSYVKLTIYNLLGQCVGVLVDEYQSAGAYSVLFDGRELPSGVYLYRIEAGGNVAVRKMAILK
jgi:5'-nucleotidase / UDP-sugar diphosphatase